MGSANYVGFLLNCPMGGDEWTDLPKGGRVRNRIPLVLNRQKMRLVQLPALVEHNAPDIWGQQVYTTDLIVPAVTRKAFPRIQRVHRRLAELLMFATQSEVRASGYRCDAVEPSARVSARVGVAVHSTPVINTHVPGALRHFLESSWRSFLRERQRRRLHIVFEYLVLSQKPGQPIEMKLITTFVLLESLKHTFARLREYPFLNGRFRERGATTAKPGKAIPFRRLVREMLREVGLRPRPEALVKVRNELIHSGMASGSFRRHRRLYQRLQNIARTYILRLLGYKGPYAKFLYRKRRPTP